MRPKRVIAHRILSLWLLGIFLFAGMPHEFLHDEITGHKDTVDYYHSHTAVSAIHIHCKFLQEVLAPYLPGQVTTPLVLDHRFSVLLTPSPTSFTSESLYYNLLRGPPSRV